MDMPRSERTRIIIIGRCNAGKSALANAIAGQEVAITSPVAGTTTDPVAKAVELPGLGACVITDTPGLDDGTPLGRQRMERTRQALNTADIAIIAAPRAECGELERRCAAELRRRGIPFITVATFMQHILSYQNHTWEEAPLVHANACTGKGIGKVVAALACLRPAPGDAPRTIAAHLVEPGGTVLLVMPQDAQAPKGRLILPQSQVLRELLGAGINALCCTPATMPQALAALRRTPDLTITDSQAFREVDDRLPRRARLTSFSILMARYKGNIAVLAEGARAIDGLTPRSRVLIAEACAHVPQGEDIGRVQLPRLLRQRAGDGLSIDIVAGDAFPADLRGYSLVVHCGACMFNRAHMMARIRQARDQGVPITNYGVAIAYLQGILPRMVWE